MIRRLSLALLFLFLVSVPTVGRAQVAIFEVSDSHSAYDRMPDFLRSLDRLRTDYLLANPDGKPVLIINGDFGGLSRWAFERGWIGMQALRALTDSFTVLYVLGNHDGFDWGASGNGNLLVKRQLQFLETSGVHVLGAANIDFSRDARIRGDRSFELVTNSQRRMRFVGLGLKSLFSKSSYDPNASAKVIETIRETLPSYLEALNEAAQNRADDVVFFQHEGHARMGDVLKDIQVELQRRPGAPRSHLSIPVAFASHDHQQFSGTIGETLLIDSRSDFDFSMVELDRQGKVVRHDFYDASNQSELAKAPISALKLEKIARAAEKNVSRIRTLEAHSLGRTSGFAESKANLKAGRSPLGTALAESLRAWGVSKSAENLMVHDTVAFYNSSSYRRDTTIPAGDMDEGLFKSFYPFPGEVTLYHATGAEIAALFKAARDWRLSQDGVYTPQLTENLAEAGATHELLFNGKVIEPQVTYALVLDAWLSANGYGIPEFNNFLARHQKLAAASATSIFIEYGPRVFAERSPHMSCRDLLAVSAK